MFMQPNRTNVARCLLGVLLLAGGLYFLIPSPLTPPLLTAELRQEAESKFRQMYQREPDHFDTVSIAAELAVSRDQFEVANQCFAEIPTSHLLYGPGARFQQGQVLLKLHQAAAAERQFREYLDLPGIEFRIEAQRFLRYLLEIELRFEERQALLATMHAAGSLTPFEAMYHGFPSILRWNGELAVDSCRQFYERDPENLNLQIAWAQYLGGTAHAPEGLTLIDSCLAKHPSNARAVAVKMYLLSELEQYQSLAEIAAALPPPNGPIRGTCCGCERRTLCRGTISTWRSVATGSTWRTMLASPGVTLASPRLRASAARKIRNCNIWKPLDDWPRFRIVWVGRSFLPVIPLLT